LTTITNSGTFEDEIFKKADLSNQRVSGTTFSDCRFVRCDFSGTEFQTCRFLECTFEDCTMKLAKVKNSTFSRVTFTGCNLLGVQWPEANWSDWSAKISTVAFENCVLEYGSFAGLELKKLKLKDCNAREANFSETDLTEADLSGTDLAGAIFLKTNLTKANFVGAKNYSLNVTNNKTKGAKFSLPEAIRLLYALDVSIVDPVTNKPLGEEDLNSPQ
jgi:fluoroquinolone resistance protein